MSGWLSKGIIVVDWLWDMGIDIGFWRGNFSKLWGFFRRLMRFFLMTLNSVMGRERVKVNMVLNFF